MSLVKKINLETTPHPCPYPLGWLHDNVETKIDEQCKIRFVITKEIIDEMACEVVPLNICQVVLGSPYLWDQDTVCFHQAQKYQFQKDGRKFIVTRDPIDSTKDLTSIDQAKRMMNACHKLVALASTCKKPNSSSTMMRKEEKPKQIATTSKPQDKKENPRVDDNRNKENLIKTAHIKDRASHDNADYIDRPKRNLQTTHGERRNLKERFNGK